MNTPTPAHADTQADDIPWLVEDPADPVQEQTMPPWRILVVDDEEDVHAVTRLVLNNIVFKGRRLELLSAMSAAQAWQVLSDEADIALVLLDVVMETNDAGLVLTKRIREELQNHMTRIVLRTGQPGQAPEDRVIIDFDINDYKSKTELTKQKLFTTVIASLRAYEGLVTIDRSRIGLSKILQGASNLYEMRSLQEFASGVLNQVIAVLDLGMVGSLCVSPQGPGNVPPNGYAVLACTGEYTPLADQLTLPPDHQWTSLIQQVVQDKKSVFGTTCALFVRAVQGREFVIVLNPPTPLANYQRDLLGVFCDRIASAFDNLHMFDLLQKGQEATVIALSDLAESRDTDTGGHVRRVAKLTDAIGQRLKARGKHNDQVGAHFFAHVGLASMLHDIGKVATPDAVLLKPGKHTPEERVIMEQHAIKGERVLLRAAEMVEGQSYLTVGADIAGGHHEHFDGNGYPRRLAGQAIPLGARIVAVVDVFDALLSKRPYKEPWPLDTVFTYLKERSGKQFDPDVVSALIDFVETEKPNWLAS